jgi:hypothetical protein
VSTVSARAGWPEVLAQNAVDVGSAARLIGQLRASEAAALAFCRLLERWARGDAHPCTAGAREAALSRAAERVETALAGLEDPLTQYLADLRPERMEARSWYGEPGAGELVEWGPVLSRAGVLASPERVAQVYLELAVLVRALEGLTASVRMRTAPDRTSLWAGLFDLRENLYGRGLEDLRALA